MRASSHHAVRAGHVHGTIHAEQSVANVREVVPQLRTRGRLDSHVDRVGVRLEGANVADVRLVTCGLRRLPAPQWQL